MVELHPFKMKIGQFRMIGDCLPVWLICRDNKNISLCNQYWTHVGSRGDLSIVCEAAGQWILSDTSSKFEIASHSSA